MGNLCARLAAGQLLCCGPSCTNPAALVGHQDSNDGATVVETHLKSVLGVPFSRP
jgi:hypothetical protein